MTRLSTLYLQSGVSAPFWSVLSWCSNRVFLLIVGFGAGRFTPLEAVADVEGDSEEAVTAGIDEQAVDTPLDSLTASLLAGVVMVMAVGACPSTTVNRMVPTGVWMLDWVFAGTTKRGVLTGVMVTELTGVCAF